ncbi:MAG: serine hydrolase domain-containing protein [Pseudomonadota bacterium]
MLDNRFFAERPADVGIDADKMEALFERVAQEVNEGLLPATQAAICRNGKVAGFRTFGEANDNSLFHVFSCTKALTSAAAWLLIEADKLNVQEKVADIIPEFADNDKQDIIVEQLFTHTAGFPNAPFRSLLWNDPKGRVEKFASWRLNWEPGTKFEYHPTSSMWVIAEIIERRSGEKFQTFVRNNIVEPLGLPDLWLSLPAEQNDRVADVTFSGDPLTSEDY